MRRFWSGGWREAESNPERIDMVACLDRGRRVRSLGHLPLRVLTASGFALPSSGFGDAGLQLQAIWQELQSRLASLSNQSRHIILAGSGHFVQRDQPEAVAEAIRELVDGLRQQQR
jgi:pimeloyl-ACP methyl ester carboxylesterase